jgi:membrane protein YdbS with pleckstrin-like domain
MSLEKYLEHNEKIIFKFKISLRYLAIHLIFWALNLFAIIYVISEIKTFIYAGLLIYWFILFYYLWQYFFIDYFVTEKHIYCKKGLFWIKVISAKQEEIQDIQIKQGPIELMLYKTGTLKFNTSGSTFFEVILPKVGSPFEVRKKITKIWNS